MTDTPSVKVRQFLVDQEDLHPRERTLENWIRLKSALCEIAGGQDSAMYSFDLIKQALESSYIEEQGSEHHSVIYQGGYAWKLLGTISSESIDPFLRGESTMAVYGRVSRAMNGICIPLSKITKDGLSIKETKSTDDFGRPL